MPNNILITPGSASIQFSGSAASTIRLQVENSGSIAFYGNSGSLFGITDQLSGSLMSVNDISGLPILEVFSDDRVVMGSFNKNTLVVTGSRVGIDKAVPTTDLDISGSVFITGSLRMSSGGITGSLFGTSSLATTSSYVLPTGLPTGTVSSSVQINTGSFSGSFTGELIGTSSWASNAISSSFATTASAATSITFTPSTASFSTSASYALSASYAPSAPGGGITSLIAGDGLTGGTITSTGTITIDTGSAHFLDGVKKELNTEGVISSSIQINTGSFTGSFTGTLIGTSSWATNAISASYFTGSVTFPSGLIVTGSILATTVSASLFIGPLTGTASFATSASFAPPTFPFTGSAIISGSVRVTGSLNILSGSISSSGPQAGLHLSGSSTISFLTIVPEVGQIRYYSNGSHTFRVGNVDALSISAFSIGPSSDNAATLGSAGVRWKTGYINNIFSSGSIVNTGSLIIRSGSITFENGDITGSLFGTSSWANNAISASYAPSAPGGGITSLVAGDGLTGGTITSTGTITVDTGSAHFLDGVKKELNTEGVISSSAQVSYTGLSNIPSGIVSSSSQINTGSFTGSFTGILTGSLFGTSSVSVAVDSITILQVNEAISGGDIQASGITADGNVIAGVSVIAPIVSASIITGSHVQLVNVTDTTSANKVLVLNTSTNKIFTTASVGGGSGNGFPYNGTVTPAVISGSLLISSSINSPLTISGSINDFFELEIVNASAGNNASSDMVVSSNNTTDFGNYAAFGINSTTYNGGLVGGPSDGYLYLTSSVGELHLGNASTIASSNVRLFAGGPSSDSTTRMFISASGNVGIGVTTNLQNTLTVNGSISASSVTGSVTGSFTGALTHFSPSTLKLTVGTTAPASPAVNDLWVDTN